MVAGEAANGRRRAATRARRRLGCAGARSFDAGPQRPGPSSACSRTNAPTLPILVLSMHHEEQYAVRALHAGALGYLTKENDGEVLVNAIRRVAAGGVYVTPNVAALMIRGVHANSEQATAHRAVRPRVSDLLPDRLRQRSHRNRRTIVCERQDRQHAQGAHPAEDGHEQRCRPGPLRPSATAWWETAGPLKPTPVKGIGIF